jgi:hypothetical protein
VAPGPGTHSEVTRHLCTAVQLDGDLARRAVRKIISEESRGVAPSLGIDLGLVVRHCLLAHHRQRLRDTLVAGLAFLSLVAFLGMLSGDHTGAAFVYLVLCVLLAWVVVTAERWTARRRVAGRMSREEFSRRWPPVLTAAEERRVHTMQKLESANFTPFGGYFPFAGSGLHLNGWSFALSVLKGAEQFGDGTRLTPQPFEVEDLYYAVRADVERLDIEGLDVEDRLYVDGEEVAGDPRFLTGEPWSRLRNDIGATTLRELVRTPERVNRVYRCIRIYGWDGEYVVSIYLNFSRTGRGLFAEARYFLLLPAKPEYLHADRLPTRSAAGLLLHEAPAALLPTAKLMFTAIPRVTGNLRDLRRPVMAAKRPSGVNYGATTSLRELVQANMYRRYFQQLDREMTSKIVERQILDSIAQFLRERNIDTSELEERQTAILNNGLIVSGGTFNAESVAVGSGAQSLLSRLGAAVRPPAEEKAAK